MLSVFFFPIRNSCTRNIAGTLTRSCRRKKGEESERTGERERERMKNRKDEEEDGISRRGERR